jgi:hypothetical protein
MSSFTAEQRMLMESMWKISEEAWSSGWMKDLEFELWRIVNHGPEKYGQLYIDEPLISQLRGHANASGGWIYWDDIEQETWVGMSEWLERYAAYLVKKKSGPL